MAGKKIIDGAIELTGDLTGGHITGTLLQSTQHTDLNKTPGSYPVFDDSGLIYSRTAEETKADLGIPTKTSQLNNDSGFIDFSNIDEWDTARSDSKVTEVSADGITYTNQAEFRDGMAGMGYGRGYYNAQLPMVAGSGISITKNANNKAEISLLFSKGASKGYVEPYFDEVSVNNDGLYLEGNMDMFLGDDTYVDAVDVNMTLPIVAGDGISLDSEDGKLVINNPTVDESGNILTSKLFKESSYLSVARSAPPMVTLINGSGAWFNADVTLLDYDTDEILIQKDGRMPLPIIAGNGVSLTINSDDLVEIASLTKRVMLANSGSGTSLIQLMLDCSFPDTITTASDLGTYLYGANKRACCVGGVFNGKPVAFGALTSATTMGVSYFNGSTCTTTNTSISSLKMTVFNV